MLILVADDCPITRRELCRLLREHQLVTVGTLAGLRLAALEAPPDVLLVDLHLPDCYALNVLPELLRIAPVILMSGYAEEWEIKEALDRGCVAVVEKGEGLRNVGAVLARLTVRSRRHRRSA